MFWTLSLACFFTTFNIILVLGDVQQLHGLSHLAPLLWLSLERRDPFFSHRWGRLITTIALQFLMLEVLSVSDYHAIARTR